MIDWSKLRIVEEKDVHPYWNRLTLGMLITNTIAFDTVSGAFNLNEMAKIKRELVRKLQYEMFHMVYNDHVTFARKLVTEQYKNPEVALDTISKLQKELEALSKPIPELNETAIKAIRSDSDPKVQSSK